MMKSPLRKLRGLNQNRSNDPKSNTKRKSRKAPSQLDELLHAAEEVQEMRNCYDSLLSAAAATANSVYEFSEALDEMGTCLLEKTALNDDEDSGRVLMLIGKAQFELQELVDSYRSNIIHTITTPSESLLKELQTVEEMKRQCDEKRDYYKYVVASYREKGFRTKTGTRNPENFTSEDVQAALQDYDDEAALFVFRLKSLQQGQFRSLLTQAARHHAAQLNFFRRGLKHLEAIEPQVKKVAEAQHIEYHFSALDEDSDIGSFDFDDEDSNESFDYNVTRDRDVSFPPGGYRARHSGEIDRTINQGANMEPLKEQRHEITSTRQQSDIRNYYRAKPGPISQSAPLFANPAQTQQLDPYERFKNMRPSSTRKLHSYALPLPEECKNNNQTKPQNAQNTPNNSNAQNTPVRNTNITNINTNANYVNPNFYHSSPMPNQSKSGPMMKMPPQNVRRDAFSGPMMKPPPYHPATSANIATSSKKLPPPPRTASSPLISELHELPRPPVPVRMPVPLPVRPSQLVGYSGPLVPKRQVPLPTPRASPLPMPPQAATLTRSLSMSSHNSPPLTPVAVRNENERKKSSGELRRCTPHNN